MRPSSLLVCVAVVVGAVVGAGPAAAADPPAPTAATAPAEVAPAADTRADPTLRVLLLPSAGDVDDARKKAVDDAVFARFQRFSGLRLVRGTDADTCVAVDDRAACLQAIAGDAARATDLVVASVASGAGSDWSVRHVVVDDDNTLAEGAGTASKLDGSFDDARTQALTRLADALIAADAVHFVEGGVTTTTTTTVVTTTTTTTGPDVDAIRRGLLLGGAAGLGVGVVAIGTGTVLGVIASSARGDLSSLRVDYTRSGDPAILEQAREQQAAAAGAADVYNGVGVPLVWTGIVLTALGGGALAAAMFALPPTPADDDDDDNSTSTTTSTP
ncbi:MAG TPA: hypothetical protein VGF99_06580 [Myxococcota bacterium]